MGKEDVDGMLDRLTPRQWQRWQWFYELEPFGPRQEELRAAALAIYTLLPHRKEGSPPLHPGDIFPSLKQDPGAAEMDDDEIRRALMGWVRASGGRVE